MKTQLTSYLTFSKKELNGILVLFILVSLILAFPVCYWYFDKPETYDLSPFRKEIALFKASAVERNRGYGFLKEKIEEEELKPEYFEFDPNTASLSEWHKLGLSSRQIKVINNYLAKGGKFFKKEDLKRIYSITDAQYTRLEPFINIRSSKAVAFRERQLPEIKEDFNKIKRIALVVELNSADSGMLDQIRGIGPAFASRIIRFRARLGGFYQKEQLKDVFGMDSLRYSQLEAQVSVDASSITKLDLNKATFDELKKHPYLSFKQINAIIQYRNQHGRYSSVDDLKKVLLMNDEIIRKIEPYLSFDP